MEPRVCFCCVLLRTLLFDILLRHLPQAAISLSASCFSLVCNKTHTFPGVGLCFLYYRAKLISACCICVTSPAQQGYTGVLGDAVEESFGPLHLLHDLFFLCYTISFFVIGYTDDCAYKGLGHCTPELTRPLCAPRSRSGRAPVDRSFRGVLKRALLSRTPCCYGLSQKCDVIRTPRIVRLVDMYSSTELT